MRTTTVSKGASSGVTIRACPPSEAPALSSSQGLQGSDAGGHGGPSKEFPAREHRTCFPRSESVVRSPSPRMVRGGWEGHKASTREMEKFIFTPPGTMKGLMEGQDFAVALLALLSRIAQAA